MWGLFFILRGIILIKMLMYYSINGYLEGFERYNIWFIQVLTIVSTVLTNQYFIYVKYVNMFSN